MSERFSALESQKAIVDPGTRTAAGSHGATSRSPGSSEKVKPDQSLRSAGGSRGEGGPGSASGPRSDADSRDDESKNSSTSGARSEIARAVGRGLAAVRKHPVRAVVGAFALGWLSGRGMSKIVARFAVALALRAGQQVLQDRVTAS